MVSNSVPYCYVGYPDNRNPSIKSVPAKSSYYLEEAYELEQIKDGEAIAKEKCSQDYAEKVQKMTCLAMVLHLMFLALETGITI